MNRFINNLHADFIKIKRQPVLWIHLLAPAAGIIFLLLTSAYSKPSSPASDAISCLGSIAASFPVLVSIVCSMIADQEEEAGCCQHLLTDSSKLRPFLSLSVMLLLLGFCAELLTAFGFEACFALLLHQTPIGPNFYFFGVLLLFGSNLFLYFLHFYLSLRFNRGVSIGVGIVESLLSLLLLTGMGDGIWMFIPCAWGMRFAKIFGLCGFGSPVPANYGLMGGILFCIIETVLMFILSLVFFGRWEGKRTEA